MFRFKLDGEFDLGVLLGIAALLVAVVGIVIAVLVK